MGNAFTVAVTFDMNISASNYTAGVTIKVNGSATSITSSTRQSNHAIVNYVIPVLWHGNVDTVTWEYNSATGNIVSEADEILLGDVTAQSVTNNCEYAALLDLQADTLALNDGDPVSTWADQIPSGGHDFTQTGDARPLKQTIDSHAVVAFSEGGGMSLTGQNWNEFNSLGSFLVITAHRSAYQAGHYNGNQLIKYDFNTGAGWTTETDYYISAWTDYSNFAFATQVAEGAPFDYLARHVVSHVKNSISDIRIIVDSVEVGGYDSNGTPTENFSNSEPLIIGVPYTDPLYISYNMNAVMFYSPQPNSTNRAALEARLAARYGITF